MITNITKNILDILFLPTLMPSTLLSFGFKYIIRGVFMDKYNIVDEVIQNRIAMKYIPDDLLNRSYNSFKNEKKRRLKIKINEKLKFKLFKIN